MKRRKFIVGLLIGLIVTGARAQQRVRISILHSGFPNRTPIHQLFEALSKLGLDDGRTATIDLVGGEGDPKRLSALVAQIGAQNPDVIIAITSPAVVALKEARLTIPVVFAFVPDPVGLGIVESLAQPGGNFTGVTYSESGLGGKRLELLLEAIAGSKKIAVFWNPSFPGHADAVESTRTAALARGIEVFSRELRVIEDLEPAFDDAIRAKAQAAIFMADNVMFGNRKRVAEVAINHRLPTIHSFPSEVEDGGLMFYGPSNAENYRRAAALAARILKGKRPGELPVERPTKFELIINLKTAKALGVTISEAFLLRADQVIE
ncbi:MULTISPECIES: ABC transporter substrate-binding protein [unclassified Bradyrhizobium]|uniref:ABC transporter substrate-binding protein n=1 Tax=unclassified Bradyrhizobium TaxID=2631580 RepID=UPI001FFBA77D|nr:MULTISPECIES: ABC transporter substrate-binding protein [unclassified Bradyrhizobium]MCK1709887.1 ABC transporter substrate-binding protein [Bradyrhizobium sp. 143]MCK1725447.1 ABC transporter substrate-binding protein [Bradyrhizobium sp. 142]